MRRTVVVALGNDLGPNKPDLLVALCNDLGPNKPDCPLCSAVAPANTEDITNILFRMELDERREILEHDSDPACLGSGLSRLACRLQTPPLSDSDSIATSRYF
jgi:hypothetical protein